jgi:hypothetical protein
MTKLKLLRSRGGFAAEMFYVLADGDYTYDTEMVW